jgi:hypothetical protein
VSQTLSVITPTESERNSWDQLPEESAKAFRAFALYRDMGWDRSVKKVVLEWTKSRSLIYRWSIRYQWKERAQDWDVYQDQLGQAQAIRTRLAMNKATLEIAQDMQAKAMRGYQALETVRKVKDPVTGEEKMELAIKPADLLRILEASHKLAKDVLGKADEDRVAEIQVIFGSVPPEEEPPLDA